MAGTGGTADTNPALSPSGFNGSRAAASAAATPSWAGLLSTTPPGAVATPSASPLVTNPVAAPAAPAAPTMAPTAAAHEVADGYGAFDHAPYATGSAELPHIGLAAPAAAPAAEVATEFAAPTSFANPWDASIAATAQVGGKGLFYSDKNWDQNPEAVRQWLQAYADAGGDYRVQDKYYNTVSPGSLKIYWPGDPARPK